ncbi:hypothetical protein IQ07DRAFT_665196 [Pyrenochaeta sp. DS3sAY3a]|nr:hypothetical protein IQ07DRAFT_665196 [Pyrenochaeta sp. DS3sAY3a]
MHPHQLLTTILALAPLITADRLLTTSSCHWLGVCGRAGEWHNNHGGIYRIDAREGCRDIDVPYIYDFCIDWGKSRAHFYADGQSKRCLARTGADFDVGPCADTQKQCSRQWWEEVACSW